MTKQEYRVSVERFCTNRIRRQNVRMRWRRKCNKSKGGEDLKKIVLIIPYFGKMPDYYKMWEMSAKANPTIDFLILTDIEEIKESGNIHVMHMQFSELKERIAAKFDFPISLNRAYKLCDYKPTYGYIFREEIKEYDFWGHCDIDLVFGDIRHFLTDEILSENDKVFEHGHFCLYRNNDRMNTIFENDGPYPEVNYKETFTTNDSFGFDEFAGMVCKCHRLGVRTHLDTCSFFDCKSDELEFKDAFHLDRTCKTIIHFSDGKLLAEEVEIQDFEAGDFSKLQKREIMYFHFQKRYLKNLVQDFSGIASFWIIPNELVCEKKDFVELYRKKGSNLYRIMFNVNRYKKKIIDHINRYCTRKKADRSYSVKNYIAERAQYNKRYRDNRVYQQELYRKEKDRSR